MIELKRATPELATRLSDLARLSKAHWDYPKEWLELWHDELTITPEYVADHHAVTVCCDGELAGMAAVVPWDGEFEIQHFWIDPAFMSRGIGRALFESMIEHVRGLSGKTVRILADPFASGFYEAMGCVLHHHEDSSILGRQLPVYYYSL